LKGTEIYDPYKRSSYRDHCWDRNNQKTSHPNCRKPAGDDQGCPPKWRGCPDIQLREIPRQKQKRAPRPKPVHRQRSNFTTKKDDHIQALKQTERPNQ